MEKSALLLDSLDVHCCKCILSTLKAVYVDSLNNLKGGAVLSHLTYHRLYSLLHNRYYKRFDTILVLRLYP